MIITITAIAFILLSIGLAFLGWKFLRVYKKEFPENDITGFLLGFCFIATSMHNGILGFGALFFASNSTALFGVSIVAHIFLTLFAILTIYTAYYIFLPKKFSSLPIFLTIIISLVGLQSLVRLTPKQFPFLTQQNSIDWNMNFTISLITFYLLLVGLGIFFFIFFRLFAKANTAEMKILSFTIAATALIGIANTFISIILLHRAAAPIRANTLAIGIGTLGIIFIFGFIIIPLLTTFRRE